MSPVSLQLWQILLSVSIPCEGMSPFRHGMCWSLPACLPAWGALQLSRKLKTCREEFTPIWDKLAVLCSESGWLLQC